MVGAPLVAALAVALAGCGGGGRPESQFHRVHFRASDGVLLDGRIFGSGGRVGVVLVHMGRPGDSQADWTESARLLSREGYVVLSFDRRGVCPRAGAGCSRGTDDYASSWRDVVGAVDFLGERGTQRSIVVGASIGAMSSLYAAAAHRIEPAGLIELAGINHASGYDFDRAQIRGIRGLKIFLSARDDILRRSRRRARVVPLGLAAEAARTAAGLRPRHRPPARGKPSPQARRGVDRAVREGSVGLGQTPCGCRRAPQALGELRRRLSPPETPRPVPVRAAGRVQARLAAEAEQILHREDR
jgi:pimeloyl-ACP methyl ester carboxylesterase